MTLRTQRSVLAAKIEAVEGTAEALAAADAILALSSAFNLNQEQNERDPFRPTLSQMTSVPGKRSGNITGAIEAKGSGTAGTVPEWDALIRACGFAATTVPATSVTYLPLSTLDPTITIAHYKDGLRKQLAGARGTFNFGGAVGEIMVMNYDFMGIEDLETDVALLSPTYQSTVPVAMKNMTFSLHGTTVVGSTFSIDMGNVLTPRQDFTKESGHASVFLGTRVPVCNFVVEEPLVATKDWYGLMKSATEASINMILGAVAGNIITVASPKFQITNITEQDDGGKAMLSIDGKLNMNAGDDELSIALT